MALIPAILLFLAAALMVVKFANSNKGDKSQQFNPSGLVKPRQMMTAAELKVIKIIEQCTPFYYVMSQVSFDALMEPNSKDPKQRRSIRGRYAQKRADYVLVHRYTGEVAAIIELDDRTHDAAKDAARDAITAAAGYKTIRIKQSQKLEETLRTKLREIGAI